MKTFKNIFFYTLIFSFTVCFTACVVRDPIQMKNIALRLVTVEKDEYASGNHLTLEWQSLDGKIKIETLEPLEDSMIYKAGLIYPRCFLPK